MKPEHDGMWPAVLVVFEKPHQMTDALLSLIGVEKRGIRVLYGAHQVCGSGHCISHEMIERTNDVEDMKRHIWKQLFADLGVHAGTVNMFNCKELDLRGRLELRVQVDIFKRENMLDFKHRIVDLASAKDIQKHDRKSKVKVVE